MMKLVLFLAASCLALHNGNGAPPLTASYKFVRCNPEGGRANCVTQQGPEMEWSPDLPKKLPASAAQYLEAEPVEDKEDTWMLSEGGSGGYEGSADEGRVTAESDAGSGESWTETKVEPQRGRGRRVVYRPLFPSIGQAKAEEKELREDHLMQL